VSFASEPGRDDSNLPPLNVVIPDDARELERDVIAYRREMRAQRRRRRLAWFVRPFSKSGGPAAIVPLIAACLALSLVGGALLSVVTMSPASAPTIGSSSAQPSVSVSLTKLPAASLEEPGGGPAAVRSLGPAAVALVPAHCGCGPSLRRLAEQALLANVAVYFAGMGQEGIAQVSELVQQYGDGYAVAMTDLGGVLSSAYHPARLTVLLIYKSGAAEVTTSSLSGSFQLGQALSELTLAGPTVR
jgi:hypothetical protein